MARSKTLHEYNISNLNKWLAVLAVLMVVVVVGMVLDDYHRSWKEHQREFAQMERERIEAEKLALEEELNEDRLASAQERLAEAEAALAEQESELEALDATAEELRGEWYVRDQRYRFLKAEYDVVKYEYQMATEHGDEAEIEEKATELRNMEAELAERRVLREETEAQQAENEAARAELTKGIDRAQRRIDRLVGDISGLEARLATLGPSLFNRLRNAPMMDFVQPSIRINQIRPESLTYSVNFGVTERVDRCTTCHLGIENPNYVDAPQPYTTHPNLDLYVGAASPHSMSEFGCTECHGGRPRGIEFSRAAHTPRDAEQEHEWKEKYGWHEMHHWEFPMLPAGSYESSCKKCHEGWRDIPGAETYNAGRQLVEYFGCNGCHQIDGYEGIPKRGPSLTRVAQKMTPDFAYRWISDPRLVRPHSVMPRIFHLENVVGGKDGDSTYWARRTQAEINGIVAYLYEHSESGTFGDPEVPRGSIASGEQLFNSIGCTACHVVGAEEDELDVVGVSTRQFGPNLEGVAAKTDRAWIYNWIRDPKAYDPTTTMPDMRLTDQEAADITAWLMTLRSPGDNPYTRGPSDPEMVEEILMEYLTNTQPIAVAQAQLSDLDLHGREVLLGEKIIGRQGCFGCHEIGGFEGALPIGTELTEEGSKKLKKFAFNNLYDEIEHSVKGWLEQKMLHPRSFDEGVHLAPLEKSRMPDFGMTEEQAQLMVSNMLGWTRHTVRQEKQKNLDLREQMVAAGERLVANRNCRGCHVIEGRGGTIGEMIEDPGYRPPNLANQGAKVQPDWLVRFLHEVTPIRPWLEVRMPSFEFTEEERGLVANYFMAAAEAHENPYPLADIATYPDASQGAQLFETYKCQQCHPTGAATGEVSASELAPNLTLAKDRLRPDWIVDWLTDPQAEMPGTNMPSFFYVDGEYFYDEAPQEIEALRDYLMTLE